jgi:hypothetical protein
VIPAADEGELMVKTDQMIAGSAPDSGAVE